MASQQQSVEQLFGAALDLSPVDRAAFLDRACSNTPELRQLVEELLAADERAGSFLEKPILISPTKQSDITAPLSTNSNSGPAFDDSSLASTSRFKPGQIIADRFAVVRFIARGGMGEVYEVEDRYLQGVHVALKMILPQIAADAGSSHRFEQEVLLARKVIHPNLCPIYDISRCDEPSPPFLFLTMKLLAGETLASRLAGPMPITRQDAVSIFHQMIGGIAAIHAAGVIHRDIKPNNVMLDHSGAELVLSIMDFGLARLHASETTIFTGSLIAGTPGYIAPELLHGHSASQATDIFALGVLFQRVLVGDSDYTVRGLSAKPAPALDTADAPPIFIHSVKEFLSEDPERRCLAFEHIRSSLDTRDAISGNGIEHWTHRSRPILTRRSFVAGSAITACAAAGGVIWKRDRLSDLFHPIPRKRFVAILNWPMNSDLEIRPMVNGVIDAISSQLSRAETFDHDLFVTSHTSNQEMKTPSELNKVRDSLGANLVLATSGTTQANKFHVTLRLLDPSSTRTLREKQISSPIAEQISLPDRAVRAAERLLDVEQYRRRRENQKQDTESPDAYAAYQAAELFRKQENGKGLDASIEKYKQAIELDPHYALAHAQLALAYLRLYAVHHDAAATDLARGNAEAAVTLNPDLVEGHLALGSVFEVTGDEEGALREMGKALSLDPSNPKTLVYQARIYSRLNQWSDAEKTFRRVLKERPNYWLAYNELGLNYYAQGKYPDALESFRAASLAAPKNALALSNVGALYQLLGNFEGAKDNLSRSLALETSSGALATMASVLRSEGKYTEALQFATKAATLKPTDPNNWLEVGDSYTLMRGHPHEARNAYLRAAQVQEEQLRTDATNGPGWMRLALYRIKSGSPENAASLVGKAESSKAGDVYSQLTKARILELLGDRDEAFAAVAACIKKGATQSQIQSTPDLESLRNDPRYKEILTSSHSQTATN